LTHPDPHSSVIELSAGNFRKNVEFIRSLIGKDRILSFVVKGNAYGHGIQAMVPLAEEAGIRHFSVFSAAEAVLAGKAMGEESDLMIMGYIPDRMLPWVMENGISFYVSSMERLKAAERIAEESQLNAGIHIELETGFHRTGLTGDDIPEAAAIIRRSGGRISVVGTATHYAGAESIANYYRIRRQIDRFNSLCGRMKDSGLNPGVRHTACSAATLTYPETRMDMVRVGIALYGFWPTSETKMNYLMNYSGCDGKVELSKAPSPLKRVMRWRTEVMSVHSVPAGEFIGYGNSCMTTVNSRFAAVPVGYCHGFSRDLSNCGYVLVRGRRAPVSGLVNMNMMMVDITEIPEAETGDEVVLIGCQGDSEITVNSFSALSQYLNYEVLVQIPPDIPRMQVD